MSSCLFFWTRKNSGRIPLESTVLAFQYMPPEAFRMPYKALNGTCLVTCPLKAVKRLKKDSGEPAAEVMLMSNTRLDIEK